jgi:hypothetical protein
VLHGRLKAVFVALLATTILIGVLGPAIAVAADPPGLARFMNAIGRVESGGNYTAYNPVSGAYGKYQILPSSWRAWAGLYLGNPYAAQTPANQSSWRQPSSVPCSAGWATGGGRLLVADRPDRRPAGRPSRPTTSTRS